MGLTMFVLAGSWVLFGGCWVDRGCYIVGVGYCLVRSNKKSKTIVNTLTGTEDGSSNGGHRVGVEDVSKDRRTLAMWRREGQGGGNNQMNGG